MTGRLFWLFTLLLMLASPARSDENVRRWTMVPEESSIAFEATQNDAPVRGEFRRFEAEIHFDPQQLADSRVLVKVDMASVNADAEEVSGTLKTADWFDVASFPSARFETREIRHVKDSRYLAEALLTIRNQELPLQFVFDLLEYGDRRAVIEGEASVGRTGYGIGQGEWGSTAVIGDAVKVRVKVAAQAE